MTEAMVRKVTLSLKESWTKESEIRNRCPNEGGVILAMPRSIRSLWNKCGELLHRGGKQSIPQNRCFAMNKRSVSQRTKSLQKWLNTWLQSLVSNKLSKTELLGKKRVEIRFMPRSALSLVVIQTFALFVHSGPRSTRCRQAPWCGSLTLETLMQL